MPNPVATRPMPCYRRGATTLIAAILVGMATSATFAQNRALNMTLLHNDLQRRYWLYVPSGYTPDDRLPLVVNLHALTRNGSQQITASGMNEVAEREGFLVAYPDAVNADWFGPQDNVGFIDALLDQVSSDYSVDTSRVYATGLSQGGMMSYILSAQRPDKFAAIASVAGPRPFDFGGNMDVLYPPEVAATPNRPFPLLHMHGTGEAFFIPYNGGPSPFRPDQVFPSVEQIASSYAENNGCDTTPSIVDLEDLNQTDNSTVQVISYDLCDTYTASSGDSVAAEVLLYRIVGGGHTWPGGGSGPPREVINRDINASHEIWDFFSRHQLPVELGGGRIGDFDGDAVIDVNDVSRLILEMAAETHDPAFDLTGDNLVNQDDLTIWVHDLKETWFGDANLDGEFSSGDLIEVFQAGKYELDVEANWAEGDWTGDLRSGSADLIAAFQDGGYESGQRVAAAVPEPNSLLMLMAIFVGFAIRHRNIGR